MPKHRHPDMGGSLPDDNALIDYLNSFEERPRQRDIARAFNVDANNRSALRQRLRALTKSGQIGPRQTRGASSSNHLPEIGVFEMTGFDDDGNGQARPIGDEAAPDLEICVMLSRHSGRAPAVGQQILARLTQTGTKSYDARIIRVFDRVPKQLFGIALASGKNFFMQPASRGKRDPLKLIMPPGMSVADGDLVEAVLQPSRGTFVKSAKLTKNLGNRNQSGAFSALALAEFNIRHEFPDAVLAEADALKPPHMKERKDLREIPLLTIDGADARDFDDAVFAEPLDNGEWRLMVAIADVSHYVRPGSALDHEARLRGNSVYLPDRVVPMLPEIISNDLCSLRPNEDRAAMVAEMIINANGERQSYIIYHAMIRSHARLTYDAVQAVYEGTIDESDCGVNPGVLHALFGSWCALKVDREKRAPLALNLKERRVIIGEGNIPLRIEQKSQNEAQSLIEDFMIAANVAAADHLISAKKLCVFRVHDLPDPKKTANLVKLAESIGADFTIGQVIRPRHFNKLLDAAVDTTNMISINEAVLRSQAKAVYSIDNIGHFGLSLRNYAHFTSPIRRYSDLLVHRALNDTAASASAPKDGLGGLTADQMADICTHITETEANATAAERRTVDRFSAVLFENRLKEIVDGVIAAVTNFGAFVRIDDGAADGLLPIHALPNDFYDFCEATDSLEGRHNGWAFSTGDVVRVKITEVTAVSGGILLDWVEGGRINDRSRHKQKHRRHHLPRSSTLKAKRKQRAGKTKKR